MNKIRLQIGREQSQRLFAKNSDIPSPSSINISLYNPTIRSGRRYTSLVSSANYPSSPLLRLLKEGGGEPVPFEIYYFPLINFKNIYLLNIFWNEGGRNGIDKKVIDKNDWQSQGWPSNFDHAVDEWKI